MFFWCGFLTLPLPLPFAHILMDSGESDSSHRDPDFLHTDCRAVMYSAMPVLTYILLVVTVLLSSLSQRGHGEAGQGFLGSGDYQSSIVQRGGMSAFAG